MGTDGTQGQHCPYVLCNVHNWLTAAHRRAAFELENCNSEHLRQVHLELTRASVKMSSGASLLASERERERERERRRVESLTRRVRVHGARCQSTFLSRLFKDFMRCPDDLRVLTLMRMNERTRC